MAKVLRIKEKIFEETLEFLKMRGLHKPGMSAAAVISTALSELIYGTPNIEDGRAEAAMILDKTSNASGFRIKGKVSRWAETAPWSGDQAPSSLSETVRESIEEISEESSIKIPEEVVRLEPFKDESPSLRSEKPPWKVLKRFPYQDIMRIYSTHECHLWVRGGEKEGNKEMRRRAVEAAFSVVPQSLHKSSQVLQVSFELFKKFNEWEKEGRK